MVAGAKVTRKVLTDLLKNLPKNLPKKSNLSNIGVKSNLPLKMSVTKTMKQCLRIFQNAKVVQSDYVYLILACVIASAGFITNSETVIIGSMLISPLLKPVTLMAFDIIKGNYSKLPLHLVHMIIMILLVIIIGFSMGKFVKVSNDVDENKVKEHVTLLNRAALAASTNDINYLWVILIAIACGMALGMSTFYDKGRFSSLVVGAGISTSVLPPLIAGGMQLAFNQTQYGLYSILLSFVNITTVFITFTGTKYFLCH